MPEFIAQHVPYACDAFVTGYLECAEWLLDDEVDRSALEGFHVSAIKAAQEDCQDFAEANADDLEAYYAAGKNEAQAGHDFFLTRNGHGAGFWDRGLGELGERLSKAAKVYGPCDTYVEDDVIYFA